MKIEGGKERLLPYTVLHIGNFIGITLTDICKIDRRKDTKSVNILTFSPH